MTVAGALSALLGAHVIIKKDHPLDPFKRSLDLVRMEEVKAAADLQEAIRELVKAVKEKDDE